MDGYADMVVLALVAFGASTLAAVAGFGGSVILLPFLVSAVGLREAIPVLTVAQLIGNASRVWFNRHELSYPVIGWFSLGGIPTAALGGYLFASAPLPALTRLLGGFLLLMVVWRLTKRTVPRISTRSFTLLGGVSSLISALVGSVGPLMAPFFLAHGLMRGAYIGTEAACTVVMHVTKLIAYHRFSLLSGDNTLFGLALGSVMIFGSFAGKRILDRVSERLFVRLIEVTLTVMGFYFLLHG